VTTLSVVRGGILTTVQDLGRWGHQASGVPVAGPMDSYSHRLANRLVGNDPGAAALEITLVGPELDAEGDVVCAVCGADFELTAGGRPVRLNEVFEVRRGERVKFGPRAAGARATLAVRGGIDVPPVLGSRSTSLISGMGPFNGRALAAGDVLPIGYARAAPIDTGFGPALRMPEGGARLRAIPGPHDGRFAEEARDAFFGGRFTLTTQSNRMGYRLEGPALSGGPDSEILSDAVSVPVEIDIAGSLSRLPAGFEASGANLEQACHQRIGGDFSTFVTTGRGGSGPVPGGWEADFRLAAQSRR